MNETKIKARAAAIAALGMGLSRYALAGIAAYFFLVYIVLAVVHLRFPFALEWIEGSMFDHVKRVFDGKPLYTYPTPEFVPSIYPPFYFYAASLAATVTGLNFFALRSVSFIASIAACGMIFLIIYRDGGRKAAAFSGAGLFIATYALSGPYFDMGRVDSLFLAFFLIVLYLIKQNKTIPGALLGGLVLSCAFLTKQTALVLSLPCILYMFLYRRPAQTLLFIGAFAIPAGAACAVINAVHGGWFYYYCFLLPGQHPVVAEKAYDFFSTHTVYALPVAVVFAAVYFFGPGRQSRENRVFYFLIGIGVIAVSGMSWMKSGGFKNVLIPMYAAFSLLFGLALSTVPEALRTAGRLREHAVVLLMYTAGILQFVLLLYNPAEYIPGDYYERCCRRVMHLVQHQEGHVLMPAYGYLASMADRKGSAHIGCINDILRGNPGPVRNSFIYSFKKALQQRMFSAILLDREFSWFQPDIEHCYSLRPLETTGPFRPLVKFWYVPKREKQPFS